MNHPPYDPRTDINTALQRLEALGCEYAFFYKRQQQAPVLKSNASCFVSASLIKVPLLLAWLMLEREGQVSREEMCCLDDEPQVEGAGFSWLLRTRQLPYDDVLLLMMSLSDNLCTNLVIRKVGLERANQVFTDALGLQDARLQRKMMDLEARAQGRDNWISAQDCVRLYEFIDRLPAHERRWIEQKMQTCMDEALLLREVPRDQVVFYHKTGSLSGIFHDWGYTREHKMFLLTQGVSDELAAFAVFGRLGRLLYEA
jgi:beta-lactamase class A